MGETNMQYLRGDGSIWGLVKPMAGLAVVGVLAFVVLGVVMGMIGAVFSFALWLSIRVLPVLAVLALLYWFAREFGWLNRSSN
jgi:hypothetical protein